MDFLSEEWTEPVCFAFSRQRFDPEAVKGFTSKTKELRDGQNQTETGLQLQTLGSLLLMSQFKELVHSWSHVLK